ncbi:hypothetical protein [Pedobacter duraquae]|uniref:Uncharacterized protein n=1 Tax=Pedobacter duraquae TaxID=425511 RepID=A0A4V3C341_9SPHI|nr:hypothetical protein [Pedobacter duraquae]TDO20599.1 hypothetical protein CLV32_3231 [Pedobacter duraquae]
MRKLLIFLVIMTLHLSSYSQKKKTRALPPPVPKDRLVEFKPDTLSLQEYSLPKLFQWTMNADVTLPAGTVFKELIKLTYGETEVNGYYSQLPLTLKKSKVQQEVLETKVPKMITKVDYYDANISGGIVTLKERGRTIKALKVFYDKNKYVSYLKDLKTGAIYKHIESAEMPVAPATP